MSEYVYTTNGEPLMNESGEIYLARTERTCELLGIIRYDYEAGYSEYEIELSCSHKWTDTYGDCPNYCPYCGAKILKDKLNT